MTQQADTRRVARNTLILYFRMLFQMAVFLYTSRVLMHVLGVENYGLYDVVGGIVVVLMFLNNSMTTCTQRFITVALGRGDADYLNRVYSAATVIHALLGIGVVVVGGALGTWYIHTFLVCPPEKVMQVYMVFGCSLLSGMLLIMSMPCNATIIAHENMGAYAAITIVDVLLKLGVTLSLYLFPADHILAVYALLMLAEAAVVRAIYWLYCRLRYRNLRFRLMRDGALYREMLAFTGWSTFGNLSLVANTQGINLMLNFFFGPLVNAARGVAFQIQTAVTAFIASFQTAINPQITKTYAQGEVGQMNRLVLTSSRLSFMLMLLMAVPLALDTDFVLQLWLPVVPAHAATFVRLLLCVSLIDCVANPMMIGAAATGRVRRYYVSIGLTLLLTLPVGYFTLHAKREPALIFVVLLATTLAAQVIRIWLCRGLFGFSARLFVRRVLSRIIIVGTLSVGLPAAVLHYVTPEGLWAHLLFCALTVGWTGLTAFIFGLQSSERQFVLRRLHLMR